MDGGGEHLSWQIGLGAEAAVLTTFHEEAVRLWCHWGCRWHLNWIESKGYCDYWRLDPRQEQGTIHISDRDSFANSAISRGFRSEATYYTQADDEVFRPFSSADFSLYINSNFQAIIIFILDHGRCKDTGWVSLWQVIKERGMVEGRSWQSLKEAFKRSIVKRLELFGLDEQQEEQLSWGRMGRGGRIKPINTIDTNIHTFWIKRTMRLLQVDILRREIFGTECRSKRREKEDNSERGSTFGSK